MSENSSSGTNDQASGSDQGVKSVSYESHQKLLSETKKEREEKRLLQTKLDDYEQAKLEAEGKLKEALDNQKKLTEKFKTDNVEIIKRVGSKAAKSQFAREAEKLGCIDVEAAFQLTDFSDLEMDAEFEYDQKKLIEKIQEQTKSKAYFYKKDFTLAKDLIPSSGSAPSKDLSQLSEVELKELLRTAK
jgi:hypothetical protein